MGNNEKRDLEIVRLVIRGWTQAVVGRTYGLTRERVRQICMAAGLERSERVQYVKCKVDIAQLYERHKAGETISKIARDVGVKHNIVSGWFKEAGYKTFRYPYKWTFARVQPLHADYVAGMTEEQIAQREGTGQTAISYAFIYHGLRTRGRRGSRNRGKSNGMA